MPQTCLTLVKDYCANCSFAGVHFIADDSKHWIERFVWLILVILSWYGSALLIIAAWDAFVTNPISFGVETTYTDWNTKMPSVAICELKNRDRIYEVADTIWPPGHLWDLEDTLEDIAYYKGIGYSLIKLCHLNKKPDPLCPMSNYSYYANMIRSDCPKIIQNCSYNGNQFHCCEYFQPIITDIGTCFILNSIQTENPKPYPMVCNRTQKTGKISFEILIQSTLYTLGEDEVPGITTLQSSTLKIQVKHRYSRLLTVRHIENDPLVMDTTIEQRACRAHSENKDGLYPKYSYSACTVACRRKAQFEICGCYDHFMLNTSESEQCNITGMACLHAHASDLTILKPKWATRRGLACDCLPSCDDTEVTIIKDVITKIKRKIAFVEIVLTNLPTERFKRNVVRSRLDLVVSVGGTTGLFVGASLLSFVELIFYFTVRFASNLWIDRRRQRNNNAVIPITSQFKNADLNIKNKRFKGPYANNIVYNNRLITNDKIYRNTSMRLNNI